MLDFFTPVSESQTYNNFSMKEKTPVAKINLRGNLENKEFASKVGKILGMILPKEACSTSNKETITSLWLGPNEWLLVSNNEITKETNTYELEQILYDNISKTNLGAITNVTDHFTIFKLSGSNIFEVLSKGCPFNFSYGSFFFHRKIIIGLTFANRCKKIKHLIYFPLYLKKLYLKL